MLCVNDICSYIENRFPPEFAEEYDNIGLLLGNRFSGIKKAVICLDCTQDVIDEAKELSAQLIITHHPVIFSPVKSVSSDTYTGNMLCEAAKNGIAIYSAHTNLDSAPGGLTDYVIGKMGLNAVSSIENNLGRICKAPDGMSASRLCKVIKREFGIDTLYSTFKKDRTVKTVAVCNGGGGGELMQKALICGADVYISGDLKHHEHMAFQNAFGIDFIEMRHYDSERCVTELLKNTLDSYFGEKLETVISDSNQNPLIDTNKIL